MLKLFLEIWYSLPIGWRRLLTALPIAVSAGAALLLWEWPVVLPGAALSFILFVLPGPSDAEKNGYNF